ncbi:hypothetical protein MNV49_003878 [Pseudohyphozyma bogoriensis]|nr:hypothetical protein MNV49_003878 [Pseudohyphozyma bogoriensis]
MTSQYNFSDFIPNGEDPMSVRQWRTPATSTMMRSTSPGGTSLGYRPPAAVGHHGGSSNAFDDFIPPAPVEDIAAKYSSELE